MNQLNNQKGAALVLTVLIITLFMVTILVLFTQVTNTTKQITTMENEISAQLVADMGIDYYRAIIDQYVNDNDFTEVSDFINEAPLSSITMVLDSTSSFQIINSHIVEGTRTEDSIPISYTSVGTANGAEYEITDTITIRISESGE